VHKKWITPALTTPPPTIRFALSPSQVLSPLAVAPAAFAEGCAASCEQECLKVAPGSGEYCASACSDECSALKEDNGGEEVESVSTRLFFYIGFVSPHAEWSGVARDAMRSLCIVCCCSPLA
jgi:hypothetical protein